MSREDKKPPDRRPIEDVPMKYKTHKRIKCKNKKGSKRRYKKRHSKRRYKK